jgi:phosphoglycolate phosphatase-like HAD superfamily hydrolase
MEAALMEIVGDSGPSDYHYDGKTDRQIVRELMQLQGHAHDQIEMHMPGLIDLYVTMLERTLANGERHALACEGVLPLLDALEARDDVVLGLLTGNVMRGAELKLAAAGIDMKRFRVNAFGSDHEHRPELPRMAQLRAHAGGWPISGERVVIVGDTPADIDCGRSIGARAVAVATGRFSVEELAAHAPAAVFPDLADTDAVLRALLAD